MNDRQDSQAEDIVDRAVHALGRTPVPPGPPPESLRAVLSADAGGRQQTRPKTLIERILKMNRIAAVAAAVMIIGAGIAVGIWASAGPKDKGAAWAAVQEKIRKVQTMTCTITMHQEGKPEFESRMMFKEGGLMRQEMSKPASGVSIVNLKEGKAISLIPGEKKAITIDMTALPEELRKRKEQQNFLGDIKDMIEKSETPLGEREVAGKTARGYEVQREGQRWSVWVDAATAEPLEMEVKMFQGKMLVTMSDFVLDPPLDDSLFSLEVPEGYKVAGQMRISEASAEDVADALRIWAEIRGGTFPNAVTPQEMVADMQAAGKPPSEEQAAKFGQAMARVLVLLANPKRNVHYASKGVKLGDKDTAIFWFLPKDAEQYKVIYGDLSIEDVDEQDLPAQPEAQETDQPEAQQPASQPAPSGG